MFEVIYKFSHHMEKEEVFAILKDKGSVRKTLNFPLAEGTHDGPWVEITVTPFGVTVKDGITGERMGGPYDDSKVDFFFEKIEEFKKKYLHLL